MKQVDCSNPWWARIVKMYPRLYSCKVPTPPVPPTPPTPPTPPVPPTPPTPPTPPVPPTPPETGNVPNFNINTDWSKYPVTGRNYNGRLCKPNEFHGTITGFPMDKGRTDYSTAATNYRYGMRGYFEWYADGKYGKGVQTGYSTSDNPKTGCVDITISNGKTATISWSVNP